MNSYYATIITFLIAVAFLRLMDFLAQRGIIESRLSRKLIHIGTGPIFVLCWLMYPDVFIGRWLAALVPLMIPIQFALVGKGGEYYLLTGSKAWKRIQSRKCKKKL